MRITLRAFLAIAACGLASAAQGQTDGVKASPDFPPGFFSDGGQYRMSDFQGKVLALYFFEPG